MKSILVLIILTSSVLAKADGLDLATHNTLIQKLESSVAHIEDKETKERINVRLADLYADRARLMDLDNQPKVAEADRKTAVKYYKTAAGRKSEDQARILLQLSHMHSLLNNNKEAEVIFKGILANKSKHSKETVGEAHAGLGEINFKRAEFKTALTHFKSALQYPIAKPVAVSHRLAWCEFNEGNYAKAESLALANLKSGKATEAQQKEISRDMATFMALGNVNQAKIDQLLALSPEEAKKANLFYLGQEADRLGNHKGSQLVWSQYTKFADVSDEEMAEINLRTAQAAIDDNHFIPGLKSYTQFFEDFKNISCKKNDACEGLKIRSRNLVHNWIKKEKADPSKHLKAGLILYTDNNLQDVEMLKWAGNIGRYQKDYATAVDRYAKAAHASKGKERTDALAAMIASAEESGKIAVMRPAYQTYLELEPTGSRAGEAKYQLAHLLYQEKKYSQAAEAFHALTSDKDVSPSLKIEAADVSLDALAAIDSADQIETYAMGYAQTFKGNAVKYLTVARRAIVNTSVKKFKSAKGDDSTIKAALTKLKSAPLAGADETEKLGIHQNRLAMATAIKDLGEVDAAAGLVLASKKASPADKEAAMEKRLWVAESRMQFKTALSIAKKMHFPKMKAADQELKLGILTQLAGNNPQSHYKRYIQMSGNSRSANVIRLEMIRLAKHPWSALKDYERALKSNPDLYTSALIEAYGRQPDLKSLKKYANRAKLSQASGAAALKYQIELEEFAKIRAQFRGQRLDSRSDSRLAKSLNQRLKLLKSTERYAQASLRSGHIGIQIRTLDTLSREYLTLYMQVQGLPVPKGLKVAERKQYRDLLTARALPFKQKSDEIKAQAQELWNSSPQLKVMLADLGLVSGGAKKLLVQDLNGLARLAPKGTAEDIRSEIADSRKESSHAQVIAELESLKADPFNMSQIAKVKQLEIKRGSTAMVAFLESRENALKRGQL